MFISMIAFVAVLSTGVAVYAAKCNACHDAGVDTDLVSCGERLWARNYTHTVTYVENGKTLTETCSVYEYEEREGWLCPRTHGVVGTWINHVEEHSSSHCN